MTARARVLVVGAGLTGAVTASILRRELSGNVKIVVMDKANRSGGRMSTSHCPEDARCTVDLGAQYLTQTPMYAKQHASFYDELLCNDVIKPLIGTIEADRSSVEGTRQYVTHHGISSLVEYFLNQADADMSYNQEICRIDIIEKDGQSYLYALNNHDERRDLFDAVVLTLPVPQAMQIEGIVQQSIDASEEMNSLLGKVTYSSRYALGLYFNPGTIIDVPWCAKYEYHDPCIRWLALDAKKRDAESLDIGPSVTVHTSAPFGIKHLESDKNGVQVIVMDHLKSVLPGLPQPISIECQRWRYSQVFIGYKDSPGAVVIKETPSYMVILGGDAFTHSNMDGCISSAKTITQKLIAFLKSAKKV